MPYSSSNGEILRVRAKAFIKVIFQIADETLSRSMKENREIHEKVDHILSRSINSNLLKELENILLEEELDPKTVEMINNKKKEYLHRVRAALETNQKVFKPEDFD